MASGRSPKRKLNLNRTKAQNEEAENSSLCETGFTSSTNDAQKNNFMKACSKVSHEAYLDFKKRFHLLYVPGCINDMCKHGDENTKIKQISWAAEHSIVTEFNNSTWLAALEICAVCITPCQHLPMTVLKNVVEIIMNAHEDTGYKIEYILRKCQYTLIMHFNMHPPCITKKIRTCYKDFLTTAMEHKELSNRKQYLSEEGIVSHCLSRLLNEISIASKDGAIIDEREVPIELEGVRLLHWRKQNLQLYELLVRTERIERCMLVLESIIYLIQTDLALWNARFNNSKSSRRAHKPLLAYLLWPCNSFVKLGAVSALCQKIMELFAYYIHLQYPERHIKTMGLWVNAIVQMFYMYEIHSGTDYPNMSYNEYVGGFARKFYKIIETLPNSSISRILEKIQPTFVRYQIGILHTQRLLHINKDDILNIIICCFDNMSWDYPVGEQEPITYKKSRLKPGKLMSYLSKKCRSLNVPINTEKNIYAKLELRQSNTETYQNNIIDTLFITFVAYLEAYSIIHFYQTLESLNKNEYNTDVSCYKSVSDYFVKQYRSIIKSLQELLVILNEKQFDEPLQKLSKLINMYFNNTK